MGVSLYQEWDTEVQTKLGFSYLVCISYRWCYESCRSGSVVSAARVTACCSSEESIGNSDDVEMPLNDVCMSRCVLRILGKGALICPNAIQLIFSGFRPWSGELFSISSR
jgi:hypothetical protein